MATILIVDDDESILEVTSAILQYKGYSIVTAENGQEALDYLEKLERLERLEKGDGVLPNLILSDTMMPVMDGRELCRRLQTKPSYSSIPFVLMSGARGAPNQDSCNYSAFLAKPYEALELLSTVERLLGEQQHTKHISGSRCE